MRSADRSRSGAPAQMGAQSMKLRIHNSKQTQSINEGDSLIGEKIQIDWRFFLENTKSGNEVTNQNSKNLQVNK